MSRKDCLIEAQISLDLAQEHLKDVQKEFRVVKRKSKEPHIKRKLQILIESLDALQDGCKWQRKCSREVYAALPKD